MSRVVLVTTSFPAGASDAAGHFVAAEADALAEEGHEVIVIAPGRPAPRARVEVIGIEDSGAFGWPGALPRLSERPSRAIGMARFVRGAQQKLREVGRVHRIVAHWLVPSAYPIALGGSAELEVVAHGSDVRLLLAAPRLVRAHVIGRLLAAGARFRFVSNELAESLAQATDRRLLDVSRVALPRLDMTGAPSRDGARRQLGVAADERLAVIVSRLVASKRVALALTAAVGTRWDRVVVLGDGPERARLERAFPGAVFLGQRPRPEALQWLAAADVLLSASAAEGAPTVVREARALGVPVVCPAVGDLARWAAGDPGIRLVGPAA